MMKLVRFGVSIEEGLLKKFDRLLNKQKYNNRSEALRDMIRAALVKEEWSSEVNIAGGIAYVYDHHQRQLVNKLLDVQHSFHDIIVSSQHVHLDHDNCMEIVMVKGLAKKVSDLFYQLKAIKGIKHIDIIKSTTGKTLE